MNRICIEKCNISLFDAAKDGIFFNTTKFFDIKYGIILQFLANQRRKVTIQRIKESQIFTPQSFAALSGCCKTRRSFLIGRSTISRLLGEFCNNHINVTNKRFCTKNNKTLLQDLSQSRIVINFVTCRKLKCINNCK